MRPRPAGTNTDQDALNKSVNQVLNGNVSPGNGLTFDANGMPATFSTDNMIGVMVRLGAAGNPLSLPAAWGAANTDITIAHNLNKVPYGFIVVAKSAACDVYFGSILPTTTTITLRTTNASADTTIWILV